MITTEEVTKLISEQASLLSERQIWVDRWEDIVEYVAPHYGTFQNLRQDMSPIGDDILDTTAVNASLRYAYGLQGNLVGKSLTWFKMALAAQKLQQVRELRAWLYMAESQLYSALDRSNFYESLNEFLLCGARFGTAVMYVDENLEEQTVDFQPIHLREITLKEDSRQRIVQLNREFYLTGAQAVEKFGAENLPEQIVDAAIDMSRTLYRFLHVVRKRRQRDRSRSDAKNMPWQSLYLSLSVGDDADQVIRESGYRTFPYIVWRMSKPSRDPWGVSPAIDNLKAIVTLNIGIGKAELQSVQLAVKPPWLVSDTLLSLADRRPGANIPVAAGETIVPLRSGDANVLLDNLRNRLDAALRESFFLDILNALSIQTKQMTVPEVQQRVSERATLLSPMVGRLESEVLDPVLERVYDIESAAGRMPPMTRELEQYGGAHIKIDYIGPLAEAQRRHHATEGNQQALQLAMPFVQLAQATGKQDPADYIDTDQATKNAMLAGGADANVLLDEAEVQKIRQAKAQAAAAQQKLALAAQAASQYKNLVKAPENGSPAAQMP